MPYRRGLHRHIGTFKPLSVGAIPADSRQMRWSAVQPVEPQPVEEANVAPHVGEAERHTGEAARSVRRA